MLKSKLLQILFVFMAIQGAFAQDIHFSQFYQNPLNLNPALTGVMNCNQRLVANYRDQWASVLRSYAYRTYSASYDQKVPVGRYDYFGWGASFWGDKAGHSEMSLISGRLSLSYAKKMGGYRRKANYLVVGADIGAVQRSINTIPLQWGSQNNNGTFDKALPNGETNLTNDHFIYADLSAGLLWFSVFDENSNFYVGAAYHHLNRANQSFQNGIFIPLYSRFTGHIGAELPMGQRTSLIPSALVMFQGPSFETDLGANLRFTLGNSRMLKQSMQFGAYVRVANRPDGKLADAIITNLRFIYDQFDIGMSYDINVSKLNIASNSNGGVEFALIYKICGPERRNVYCPHF